MTGTWASMAGFQSESNMMTVSAVCRFRPSPPARVDSRKQNAVEPSALKSCKKSENVCNGQSKQLQQHARFETSGSCHCLGSLRSMEAACSFETGSDNITIRYEYREHGGALLSFRGAVQPQEGQPQGGQGVADQVQRPRHLAEQQHPVPCVSHDMYQGQDCQLAGHRFDETCDIGT